MGVGAGSAFANAVAFAQESSGSGTTHVRTEADARAEAEAEQRRMDAEIENARARLMELGATIEAAERECQQALAELRQREQDAAGERTRRKDLEDAYTAKKATMEMLSDVDGNAQQLRALADASRARLVELAREWESRRVAVLEAIRAQRDGLVRRREDCERKLREVKTMRAEMKAMIAQAREREESVTQLAGEYERMPKDLSRTLYTRRILDIVKNVKKQDAEIHKILADTRAVHKDINTAAETMGRAYATCDEIVFAKASQDINAKPAYKAVVELHSAFERLSKLTEESGRLGNNSRDMDRRIAQVEARNDSNNEERAMADLREIKAENAALSKRLKAQRKEE
jgi:chromosome segregation ATPase